MRLNIFVAHRIGGADISLTIWEDRGYAFQHAQMRLDRHAVEAETAGVYPGN